MIACVLILVFVAFIASRLLRSTTLWWNCISAILGGLLIGMLGKEVVNKVDNNDNVTTSIVQLDGTQSESVTLMQSLVLAVTVSGTICHSGVASKEKHFVTTDLSKSNYTNINILGPPIHNMKLGPPKLEDTS